MTCLVLGVDPARFGTDALSVTDEGVYCHKRPTLGPCQYKMNGSGPVKEHTGPNRHGPYRWFGFKCSNCGSVSLVIKPVMVEDNRRVDPERKEPW